MGIPGYQSNCETTATKAYTGSTRLTDQLYEPLYFISKTVFCLGLGQYICPRNVNFVEEGRRCLEKCSSDFDCAEDTKFCLCDGACGLSCVDTGENTKIDIA